MFVGYKHVSVCFLFWDPRLLVAYQQYLNCKILHGGTLLQPWPNAFGLQKYFSEDYIILSPKLNDDQKKSLHRKLKCFLPKLGEDQKTKKKVFADSRSVSPPKSIFPRNLVLYSAVICRIYSCCLALFRRIIQRSNIDGETPKPRWGDAFPLQFKYCQPVFLWFK